MVAQVPHLCETLTKLFMAIAKSSAAGSFGRPTLSFEELSY